MSQSFYIEKTKKQNTKTAYAKSDDFKQVKRCIERYIQAPKGGKEGPQGMQTLLAISQTFGGLRTPAYGWTPTGAGPTASPRLRRGFGHLLAGIGGRNPPPSRDGAATSIPLTIVPKSGHQS